MLGQKSRGNFKIKKYTTYSCFVVLYYKIIRRCELIMNKKLDIFIFGILSFVLGALVGAVVYLFLRGFNIITDFIWNTLPELLGVKDVSLIGQSDCGILIFDVGICVLGGLVIGLWQRKVGIFPESLEEVLSKVKKDKGYSYDKVHIIIVSAIISLVFGAAVGPEAGLTGVIAGLCTFVGDRLKYKGDRVKEVAGAGLSATLGVIFNAPLYGIFEQIEDRRTGKVNERERLVSKVTRGVIYALGVIGGVLTFKGLGALLGELEGLPRFSADRVGDFSVYLSDWMWGIPLIIAGIILAVLYALVNKLTLRIGEMLLKYRVISCVIAGILLGVVGHFVSSGRFSGEDQMGILMESYQEFTVLSLVILGLVKLIMVNVSVNLGWKGGTIFPMIYSAVAVGYAGTLLIQNYCGKSEFEAIFAVALVAASMLGFLMRKPITVVAILLLCFPLTYLPALIIASLISSYAGRFIFNKLNKNKN